VIVTFFGGDLRPTMTWLKANLVGEGVTGYTPVPVSVATCGLPAALSLMVISPAVVPFVLGVNVTVSVQLPRGGTAAPQL
jgi:hypothetical protein